MAKKYNYTKPTGRPTDYDPAYCEQLIDHMKQGNSFEAFGAVADCSEQTLYNWREAHPEFLESYKRGLAFSRKFWEDLGIVGTVEGKNFNAATWIFNMKNRFSWRDKQDITTNEEKIEPTTIFIVEDKPPEEGS